MEDDEISQAAPAGPDLSALRAEFEAEELAQAAAPAAAAQAVADAQAAAAKQAAATTAEGLREALTLARAMVAPMFAWWPEFGACWSDGQVAQISDAGAQVMQRHGLSLGEAMDRFGPYVMLAVATVPPAATTYAAIRARRAALDLQGQRPQPQPAQVRPEVAAAQGERIT